MALKFKKRVIGVGERLRNQKKKLTGCAPALRETKAADFLFRWAMNEDRHAIFEWWNKFRKDIVSDNPYTKMASGAEYIMGAIAQIVKPLSHGLRISIAPEKPMATAIMRRGPMGVRKRSVENTRTQIGEVKIPAPTCAIGAMGSEPK